MTSPYVIREVDGDDHELEIRALHDETFGDEAPNVDASEDGYWWLVYHDKQPVAFAGLAPSLRYLETGYLKRSGVVLGHRGMGLQRRLIRAREAKARKLGWTCIVTDTSDNPESANNLIKAGYRIYRPAFEYGFRYTIYWRKDLHGIESRRSRAAVTGGASGDNREAAGAGEARPEPQDQRAEDAGVSDGNQGLAEAIRRPCGCQVECVAGCYHGRTEDVRGQT